MDYQFDFSAVIYNIPAFKAALMVTLKLTCQACVLGTLLGVPVAAVMLLPKPFGNIVAFPVEVIRAIPDLLLFFFFYYFPYRDIIGITTPRPFVCALLAMTIALGAFCGVLFRDGVRRAPRNQLLGARAIGLTEFQVARYVVMPSVIRHALPALIAFWIGILKMSSLASVIGVQDVTYVAKINMAQSFRSLEAWTAVALIYACLVIPTTYGLRLLERTPWMHRQ